MKDQILTLRIEPIHKKHKRKDFVCSQSSLADYLQRHARQNDEKNIARSFVAVDDNNTVHGYYSLSTFSIEFKEIPEEYATRLPHYPVPAVLLGKLAVDKRFEGLGLGSRLLIDALQRILKASSDIAIKVVIVDAIAADAKAWYRRFGFIELPGHELKLFLPIETIEQLFV